MTRVKRLAPVQKVMEGNERDRAGRLGAAQRRLDEAQARLAELERYHAEYAQSFNQRASAGLNSSWLRDYQVFLARLLDAVNQQRQVVTRMRAERDGERRQWQEAARRVAAVETVVERWRSDERIAAEQREQRETDERATLRHGKQDGYGRT